MQCRQPSNAFILCASSSRKHINDVMYSTYHASAALRNVCAAKLLLVHRTIVVRHLKRTMKSDVPPIQSCLTHPSHTLDDRPARKVMSVLQEQCWHFHFFSTTIGV